jgi:hypothetical protein
MNYFFDYGEFLLCFAPIFMVIGIVALLLLANSMPGEKKKQMSSNDTDRSKVD